MARVSIQCPQCAAPLDFLEECNVVRCGFCGSSLLVAGRDGILRYVLEPKLKTQAEVRASVETTWPLEKRRNYKVVEAFLLHVPFWRIQGRCYSWFFGTECVDQNEEDPFLPPQRRWSKELVARVVDHTILAKEKFPLETRTLGVRTQTMTLKPLEVKASRSLLQVDVTKERALEILGEVCQRVEPPKGLKKEFVLNRAVGVRLSLVFLPMWYVEISSRDGAEAFLIDAMDGKVSRPGGMKEGWIGELLIGEQPEKWEALRLVPFRCPNCGWDLPHRPQDTAHLCSGCLKLWTEKRGNWIEIPYEVALHENEGSIERCLWMPFWKVRVGLVRKGQSLEKVGELRTVLGSEGMACQMDGKGPIWFYIPAKIYPNPKGHQDLATRLTSLQPSLPLGCFPSDANIDYASIELSQKEAMDLIPSILAAMVPPGNRRALGWLLEARIVTMEIKMCFLPFRQEPLFWREIHTGAALPRGKVADSTLAQRD